MKTYLAKLNGFILITGILLLMPRVMAGTLLGPASSTTGSYTIAATGNFCDELYLSYQLLENNRIVQSGCRISKSFIDKPTSTYHYKLLECEHDHPELTLLVGFVDSDISNANIISIMRSAVINYDDGLEYTANPTSFNTGYNSNGFAKGLIDLVGKITPVGVFSALGMKNTIEISINNLRFPGLNKPVPKSEFGH